jgi:hypothetical protein
MKPETSDAPLIVAVGRITLRPEASRLRFIIHTIMSLWQAKRAEGCVHASTNGGDGAHYSMSVWRSEAAMRAFARSGAHLRAMRAARGFAEEARFRHWHATTVPDWSAAFDRFRALDAREPQRDRAD